MKTYSSAAKFLARHDGIHQAVCCGFADARNERTRSAIGSAQTRNPLPILFLTGHGDIASTVQAMRGGAEDFLEKNAPKAKLLDAVKRAIARFS